MIFTPANRKIPVMIAAVLLLGGILFAIAKISEEFTDGGANGSIPHDTEPRRMSMTGTVICLEHKVKTGAQTDECAIGIRTEEGDFALDFGLMSQGFPEYAHSDRISANGVMTPVERLSTDHWQRYDMIGIFSVTDSFKKL